MIFLAIWLVYLVAVAGFYLFARGAHNQDNEVDE